MKLKNKIAIVTGGASGFGAGIVRKFIAEGAKVVIADINISLAEKLARELGEEAISAEVDVSDNISVKRLVESTISKFETIDILVNNAGITKDNLLMRMGEEDFDKVIEVNLKSVFNMTKAVQRTMLKQRKGSIINMSSVVGVKGNAGQTNYAASKAGIIGFSKSIALELGSRNIRCNAIAPGFIETEMTKSLNKDQFNEWAESIPLKRTGSVKDVANTSLFLASDMSSYITGQVINVCGGMLT